MSVHKRVQMRRPQQKNSPKPSSPVRHRRATARHKGLAMLRYLIGVKKVRNFLGLSLAQVGEMCKVSPALVSAWQSNKRFMPREDVVLLGKLVAQQLSDEYEREVGVWIDTGKIWTVTAGVQCRRCRKWFEFHRASDRLCPDCRSARNSAAGE